MGRFCLIILIPLLLLAACTSKPAAGGNYANAFMPPERERHTGACDHSRPVAAMGGIYSDPTLNAYVTKIGQAVIGAEGASPNCCTFTIIDSDDVNAFVLPGGYVHVTRGLLALADNEAELASVLAHEVGHVAAGHSSQRLNRTMTAAQEAAGIRTIAAAEGLPADIVDLTTVGAPTSLQRYSREQELEADRLGARYLRNAGYDPTAMVTFLEHLRRYSLLQAKLAGRSELVMEGSLLMASHPGTAARIAQAGRLAEQSAASDAKRGRDTYLERIDGLIFGDSPEQGLRVGRDFYHRSLRFAFRLPPGFVVVNRADPVVAHNPQGALIALDRTLATNLRDPAHYVRRDWGSGLDLTDVERIDAGTVPAAVGTARVHMQGAPVDVRLVAIQTDSQRDLSYVYRIVFITSGQMTGPQARALKETVDSFRHLSEAEAAAIEPLRIHVITVKPGDTVHALAAILPFADHQIEWFLVVNRIDPKEPLTPGETVKIVSQQDPR